MKILTSSFLGYKISSWSWLSSFGIYNLDWILLDNDSILKSCLILAWQPICYLESCSFVSKANDQSIWVSEEELEFNPDYSYDYDTDSSNDESTISNYLFYIKMWSWILLDLEIFHAFSDLAWSHYFPKEFLESWLKSRFKFWKSRILIDTDILLGKFSNLDWNWDLKKTILILAW